MSGFELATKMGITLIPYSRLSKKKLESAFEESKDGFYAEEFGVEIIYYNDIDKSYKRINMTILHEIGHCVLDHTGHSDREEDEANFFAKYAIAPPVLIDRIGADSPEAIYDAFDISYQAAIYAYEYYLSWKRRHELVGSYTEYEKKLIAHYKKVA